MGIAIGITFVPTLGIIVHHFPQKYRALATGVALSGGGCGGVVFPIMINHLLQRTTFANTVRASGYLALGCLSVALLVMRTRKLPPMPGMAAQKMRSPLEFFKEVPYDLLIAGSFISISGVYFPVFYIQLYAVQHQVDTTLAFYSLAIINGVSMFGRVMANHMSDSVGPFNVLIVSIVITASTIWAMLGVHDRASLIVVSVFYGFFSGAVFALFAAANAFISQNPREIGIRNGLGFGFGGIAVLIAGPIQGALLTTRYQWIRPAAYSAALMYAAAIVLVVSRTLLARQRGTQRV